MEGLLLWIEYFSWNNDFVSLASILFCFYFFETDISLIYEIKDDGRKPMSPKMELQKEHSFGQK